MKVEMMVDWKDLHVEPRKRPEPRSNGLEAPRSQAERRLWYIALGREIDDAVRSGRFGLLAEVSRACVFQELE